MSISDYNNWPGGGGGGALPPGYKVVYTPPPAYQSGKNAWEIRADLLHLVKNLPSEKRWKALKELDSYVFTGVIPEPQPEFVTVTPGIRHPSGEFEVAENGAINIPEGEIDIT
jgi:hypothetical protein